MSRSARARGAATPTDGATIAVTPPTGVAAIDTANVQAAINASPTGSTLVFPPGTYSLSARIVYKGNRRYVGSGRSMAGATSGTQFKQANAANIIGGALWVPSNWDTNIAASDGPVSIDNLSLDGNYANNGSSTVSGLLLMNYWSTVERCAVKNSPAHGISLVDRTKNGTQIVNSSSENRISDCRIETCVLDGIYQECKNGISNQDGYLGQNIIVSCRNAINFERGSGWWFTNNHAYGITDHGILLTNCYATHVLGNEIEDYGTANVNGTYYAGISVTQLNGRGTVIAHNFVGCTSTSGTSYNQSIVVNAGSSQTTARAVVNGNILLGANGPNVIGLVYQVAAGGVLNVKESGNDVGLFASGKSSYVGPSVTVS